MTDCEPSHKCHCQTTERRVALLLGGTENDLANFGGIVSGFAGTYHEALSVLELPIGGPEGFASVAALRDFVLAQWTAQAPSLRCCWLEADTPATAQLTRLAAARPLSHWASESHTPLQAILDERRILTWFQPIFTGETLKLWGYECLARAEDSDGKLIPPVDLFRWARTENLIFMLDRVCREKHIENFAAADIPEHVNCLINFLPSVIYDPAVCLRSTFAAARRKGLDPDRVIFEVVETERIDDSEHLRTILDEYRAAGFRVALDDVGAGHADLSLIDELAPDIIKIDRSLVAGSVSSTVHAATCRSIIDIARAAGKLVLAEGVETLEEFAFFQALRCDLYQGFLLGKPQPVPAATPLHNPLTKGLEAQA